MRRNSSFAFIAPFAIFFCGIANFFGGVSEAAAENIRAIEVTGNQRVEVSTILNQLTSSVGGRFNSDVVAADVKTLYRTGYFDQVVVAVRHEKDDAIIEFRVVERPAVRRTRIEGNKEIESGTIKEKLNLTGKLFLDKRKIDLAIDELTRYYQGEGYYGTTAKYDVEPIQGNQVDLLITVKEGEKLRIRKVDFDGIHKVDKDDLVDVIETAKYKWWKSWILGTGVVKEEVLANDTREITKYYLNHGFVDVKVGDPKIENVADGLRVIFPVEEGDIYKLGKIGAQGDLFSESVQATIEGIGSKSDEIFNLEQLRKDTFAISEKFTDIGFAFANVEPSTNLNRDKKTVDVTFNVSKGNRITVDRVTISGNKKTRDNVIRRTLQIGEQEIFSSSKVKRSQELLQRLGYFDEVTVTPETSERPDRVNLNVAVKEGNTGTFSAGAGISSGDGFIISSRVSENNLFGSGRSISLDLNTGSRRENYVLSFTDPRVNDSRWSLGMDLLATKRQFDNFDRGQQGGSLTAGYPLWFLGPEYLDDVRFSLEYSLVNVDINDLEDDTPQLIKDQQGSSIASSVTPQIVRNTIDNPLDPTKGSKQTASVETAGLGGDEEFVLYQLSNSYYRPIYKSSFGNFIFAQRLRFGYGRNFDGSPFPVFKRFFPGGINSVRGFDTNELGPKDENGNEFGGNKQFVANFELIFPIFQSVGLSGVTFYDAGNAFDDDVDVRLADLRQAIGWGIRWRSPLAPIRVEFGYPLDKEEGDKSFVTNFSFGAPN